MARDAALAEKVEDLTESDGPWPLPEGWCWTKLGNVLPIAYGKALPDRDRTGSGEFEVFGSSGPVGSHDKFVAPARSIMVGRKGSAGSVFYSEKPTWPIDTAYFTPGSAAVDIRYGYWFLWFRKLGRLDQSTAIPSLSRDIYDVQPIPLAPLPEQRRIVARVEALFAEIAEGEAALAAARKGLNTFRRALLKAAVTGELTKDWRAANPATETGHDLLARIAKDSAAKDLAKGRGRRGSISSHFDASALPILPDGWDWASLGELSSLVTDGDHNPPKRVPNGIPHITAKSIKHGRVTLEGCSFVSEDGYAQTAARYTPLVGDILITCVGTLGEIAIFNSTDRISVDRNIAAVRLQKGIASEFVALSLNSPKTAAELRRASGSTAQPHLYLKDIRAVAIPVPPPAEATEILRRVSEALAATDDTLAMLDAEAADAARLKQSILKAAFEGRLVSQEADDEPASALLARIAANPSPAQAKPRRGRKSDL